MSGSVEIRGDREVHQMLRRFMAPELTRRAQKATVAGAKALKPHLKAEAGHVSKRMARAVSVRAARKDRPASLLYFRGKLAWFRHFVIGGTRAHGPRRAKAMVWKQGGRVIAAHHVRGVRPNPMVERVYRSFGHKAIDAMADELNKES